MREILFRGKGICSQIWLTGSLIQANDGTFILEKTENIKIEEPEYHEQGMGCGLEDRNITDRYEAMAHGWECALERQVEEFPAFIAVDPETIGQFTGLIDKHGVKIFEGDRVLVPYNHIGVVDVVWDDNRSGWSIGRYDTSCLKIVDNIHEDR